MISATTLIRQAQTCLSFSADFGRNPEGGLSIFTWHAWNTIFQRRTRDWVNLRKLVLDDSKQLLSSFVSVNVDVMFLCRFFCI